MRAFEIVGVILGIVLFISVYTVVSSPPDKACLNGYGQPMACLVEAEIGVLK